MSLISENIKYLRKLNGLTQDQFSRRIGIKRSLLGAYEEARANPNPNNLVAIAKAFNTTIDSLTRHDLRKLKETPNLSMSFDKSAARGDDQPARPTRSFLDDDSDLIDSAVDLADVPKPLASVLEKYYRTPGAAQPPAGPHPAGGAVTSGKTTSFLFEETESPVSDALVNQPNEPRSAESTPGTDRPAPSAGARPTGPVIRDPQPARPGPDGSRMPDPVTSARPAAPTADPLPAFNNAYDDSPAPIQPAGRTEPGGAPIPLVMLYQFGEYVQRYSQTDYIDRLPALRLPTLPMGLYRAFEADADFPMPGALLIGQFIRNWYDIADGRLYMLISRQQGVVCRRVFNQVKIKGTLLLTADKASVSSRELPLKEVLEVWEIKAFFSQQLPDPAPNLDRLRQLVDEMRFEVERIQ